MPGEANDMHGPPVWGANMSAAIAYAQISESRVTDMVTRILAAWYKVKQDQGYPEVSFNSFHKEKSKFVNVQGDHANHIREVGAASSILLKNSNGILPLKDNIKIAVLGSDAGPGNSTNNAASCPDHACSDGTIAIGWGSGTANFPYIITPLDGIINRSRISNSTVVSLLKDTDMENAHLIAKSADVVVVFVSSNSGEGHLVVQTNIGDRNDLNLWNNGDALIKEASAANKNVVVVIHGPGAVNMPWINDPNVVAVIHALFPGQESGNAIADVLFGDVNPSGRLPFTINEKVNDYPAIIKDGLKPNAPLHPQVNYTEGLLVDYRYNDAKNVTPLFEFGFGLSYTTFVYSDFSMGTTMDKSQDVSVEFQISNTGSRDGHEIAQLYLGFPASAGEPPKQLKDFDRKMIQKGQSQKVTLVVKRKEMQIWDVVSQSWIIPQGTFTVFIGSSSRNIKWTGEFLA